MYAKIKDNVVIKYPYGFVELQEDNVYTNFNGLDIFNAFLGTNENVEGCTLEPVHIQDKPEIETRTQKLVQSDVPSYLDGKWTLCYAIEEKQEAEVVSDSLIYSSDIRAQRNARLSASDWTQTADSPANRTAWATYRQALRDITTQVGFPFDTQWPTLPLND